MADLPNVNAEEIGEFKAIAGSAEDGPVLMLNLNRYVEEANFPDGKLYHEYMTVLDRNFYLRWAAVFCGVQKYEVQLSERKTFTLGFGIWYPSHQAFLDLMTAPSSAQNMELRSRTVAHADLHRCDAY